MGVNFPALLRQRMVSKHRSGCDDWIPKAHGNRDLTPRQSVQCVDVPCPMSSRGWDSPGRRRPGLLGARFTPVLCRFADRARVWRWGLLTMRCCLSSDFHEARLLRSGSAFLYCEACANMKRPEPPPCASFPSPFQM